MTTQEAKIILTLHRPGSAEAKEPEVAAALALARQDPELKHWFEEHRAVQSAIRERFAQITAPEGLKEQILSENQARRKIVWWRQPVVLAAAAVLVVCLGIATFWLSSNHSDAAEASFETFRKRMVGQVLRSYAMTLETGDANLIRAELTARRAPDDYVLPANLKNKALAGCGVLSWRDKKVAMICFRTGKPMATGQKSDLFLFVVEHDSLNKTLPIPAGAPEFARVKKLATASWSDGGRTYLLATSGDESMIREFF